jgi:hypothetical protein
MKSQPQNYHRRFNGVLELYKKRGRETKEYCSGIEDRPSSSTDKRFPLSENRIEVVSTGIPV